MASTYETLLMSQVTGIMANMPLLYSSTFISSTTATVTLAVPANYNNVEVVWRARMSDAVAAEQMYLQMNGDSGSNYLWQYNQANNATTVSGTSSAGATTHIQIATVCAASATANYFSSGRFTASGISDTLFTTVSGIANAFVTTTNSYTGIYSGQWNSTAAVTSLTLAGSGGSFVAGSRFSVYVFN